MTRATTPLGAADERLDLDDEEAPAPIAWFDEADLGGVVVVLLPPEELEAAGAATAAGKCARHASTAAMTPLPPSAPVAIARDDFVCARSLEPPADGAEPPPPLELLDGPFVRRVVFCFVLTAHPLYPRGTLKHNTCARLRGVVFPFSVGGDLEFHPSGCRSKH